MFMKAKVEVRRNWHVFSGILLFGLEKSLAKAGRLMNRFATARLGVAIERHRLAKGSLPDDLDELVSTYIDAIPVDISTGNPVEWERKGKPSLQDSQQWMFGGALGNMIPSWPRSSWATSSRLEKDELTKAGN